MNKTEEYGPSGMAIFLSLLLVALMVWPEAVQCGIGGLMVWMALSRRD